MAKDSLTLEEQLSFPIYLVSKEIIRKYTPWLDKLDLTYTQYIVMMYFWEREKSNVKEIGKILLLDSSTLTPLLKKLEKKGFITRERSSVDERNLEVALTEKGRKLKEKAKNIPEKMKACIDLSENEIKTLFTLMNKVLRNIEREDQE